MKFRIKEVDPDEPHIRAELIDLHDLTFFDPAVRPDLHFGHWWLVYCTSHPLEYEPKGAIAFCGLTSIEHTPGSGYLKRAGVLKAYRGQGLQRRMITVRERKARKLGLRYLLTDTTDNLPSANSLIGAGYRLFEPNYKWAFQNSLYWRKDLTK